VEILSNFAMTLDGKIAPASREFAQLGTDLDWQNMLALRAEVDAVIFGATNMRAYKQFGRAPDWAPKQPASVVISHKLAGFSTSWPFFKNPSDQRLLAVTSRLAPAVKKKFSAKSQILELSPKRPLAPQLVKALEAQGMKRLLIEGGGAIMWEFAKFNLINEYHVTLVPKILGGADAPTMVEGEGFTPKKLLNLKLVEARPIGDELYLIYRK
jgi:riboflavin-specific deaminase-like protein